MCSGLGETAAWGLRRGYPVCAGPLHYCGGVFLMPSDAHRTIMTTFLTPAVDLDESAHCNK